MVLIRIFHLGNRGMAMQNQTGNFAGASIQMKSNKNNEI